MIQGFTRCAPCYVHVTVLCSRSPNYFTGTIRPCSSDSSRSPVHLNRPPSTFSALFSVPVSSTILHPRPRNHPPSSSPKPFSILVTELFHRDYSALFIRFVSQPRSPQPSSVHVFSSVLHPRLRNCSSFSFSALFTGFVSGTVLHPRHRRRPPSSSPEPSSVPFPEPSSILVFSSVHRIRLRNRSPSSFSSAQFFWM